MLHGTMFENQNHKNNFEIQPKLTTKMAMAEEEPELMMKNSSFQPFPKDLFNWKLVTDDFLEASKGKTKMLKVQDP